MNSINKCIIKKNPPPPPPPITAPSVNAFFTGIGTVLDKEDVVDPTASLLSSGKRDVVPVEERGNSGIFLIFFEFSYFFIVESQNSTRLLNQISLISQVYLI